MDYLKKLFMGETQKVLDIEAFPLSESMQPRLHALGSKRKEANKFTIFRTPHSIFKSKKNLFEPSVISIGPFHRGQKHLQAMEEQKWRFLHDFLSRGSISLDLCISEMKLLEERTRWSYSETVDLGSNAFVQMMLLDGCFVLEYLVKHYTRNLNSIIEVGWNSNFVIRDLLLLENQIPFFIIEKLFHIGFQGNNRRNFALKPEVIMNSGIYPYVRNNLVDHFVRIVALTVINHSIIADQPPREIHHLVHLCYHCLVPHPQRRDAFSKRSFGLTRMFRANRIYEGLLHWFYSWSVSRGRSPHSGDISSVVIPSATELKQKGLKFKPNSNPEHMLDISFEHGVLKIPKIAIMDSTKPFFANLIAFEHSRYRKKAAPFTCFVAFLDNLVNTPNDVTILQQYGIIENWLGSEEEVAHFINQVTEGNSFGSDQYLAELYKKVNKYSKNRWNRYRAKVFSDYFSNPWATISLIAAFIILVATLEQSFFSAFSYFRPKKP